MQKSAPVTAIAAVTGLHFAPFWLWLNSLGGAAVSTALALGPLPAMTAQQPWVALGCALLLGRTLALGIEGWILARYLGLLATADDPSAGAGEPSQQQAHPAPGDR